ncbi:MAG TPA: hypothetical protein PLX08_02265 [Bacteroidales bacterium]|jgi:hypothetical protein|nr:hypothetical protein [Bacteroidales bacterium]
MRTLLEKLNYKGQQRIALINAEKNFSLAPVKEIKEIQIDNEIDPRYPYDFMIIFVKNPSEVDEFTPAALHNLKVDGILWFCYPKKNSKNSSPGLDRDHGWKALNDLGFFSVRLVNVDDDWSAMRFRNAKFIKSASDRFKPGKEQ